VSWLNLARPIKFLPVPGIDELKIISPGGLAEEETGGVKRKLRRNK
jgi:hypothetical protein